MKITPFLLAVFFSSFSAEGAKPTIIVFLSDNHGMPEPEEGRAASGRASSRHFSGITAAGRIFLLPLRRFRTSATPGKDF